MLRSFIICTPYQMFIFVNDTKYCAYQMLLRWCWSWVCHVWSRKMSGSEPEGKGLRGRPSRRGE